MVHPGIFFGLALFFGIFFLSGSAANMFLMYVVGLTGMGICIILTGLTIPKISAWIKKSFETDKNYLTMMVQGVVLLAGVGMLFGSIDYWRDIPLYNDKKFEVISGKPASVTEYRSKGNRHITGLDVEIKGELFYLDADLPDFPAFKETEELKEKRFIIFYLPNSNWIIDYQIST